jgi:hypothetical protein
MHLILIPSPLFLQLVIDKNEIQNTYYRMIMNNVFFLIGNFLAPRGGERGD